MTLDPRGTNVISRADYIVEEIPLEIESIGATRDGNIVLTEVILQAENEADRDDPPRRFLGRNRGPRFRSSCPVHQDRGRGCG